MLTDTYPLFFADRENEWNENRDIFEKIVHDTQKLEAKMKSVQKLIDGQLEDKSKGCEHVWEKGSIKLKKGAPKLKILPMTPLDSNHKIRFHYKCSGPYRTDKTPGCPVMKYFRNGDRELEYKNGTIIIQHGSTKFTYFPNGDRLQEFQDGATAYLYAKNGTIEFRHGNERVVQYKDGRRDKYCENGEIITTFHSAGFKQHS